MNYKQNENTLLQPPTLLYQIIDHILILDLLEDLMFPQGSTEQETLRADG